jgi:1,4-dihydroxy-2-naphthoate octaprenyltransferase
MNTAQPMTTSRVWLEALRLRTLPAAIVPVLLGITLAAIQGEIPLGISGLILFTAILIQLGTNFANEYYDYLKGADTPDRVGFIRGTSAGLIPPVAMKRAYIITMMLALFSGLSLVYHSGWPILVIGLLSIFFGVVYTAGPYPLAYVGLGDIFVFLFFGVIAVNGTYYVLTQTLSYPVLVASLACGALSTNILVVNNLRDSETDRKVGKKTLGVRFGDAFLRVEYLLLSGVALAIPPHFYVIEHYNAWVFLPFLVLPLGVFNMLAVWRTTQKAELNGVLSNTAAYMSLFGFLFCIGLWLARP